MAVIKCTIVLITSTAYTAVQGAVTNTAQRPLRKQVSSGAWPGSQQTWVFSAGQRSRLGASTAGRPGFGQSLIRHLAPSPSSVAHPQQPAASHRAKAPQCRDEGCWRKEAKAHLVVVVGSRRAGEGSRGRGGSERVPRRWRWGPAVRAAGSGPGCSRAPGALA